MKGFVKKIINMLLTGRTVKMYNKKIAGISALLKPGSGVPKSLLADHQKKWAAFGTKIKPEWINVFYTINGIADINYVPESIYYAELEPRLNNTMLSQAYSDKNFYDNYYKEPGLFPETLLRKIDGVYYTKELNAVKISQSDFQTLFLPHQAIVLKDTLDTGGGVSVRVFKFTNGKYADVTDNVELSTAFLEKTYPRDFIIQAFISQHPFFAQFNPGSLNTLRVFTYRSVITEEIVVLHTVLRIGRAGSVVDNQASGGISCGINVDGKLNKFAVDKYGKKVTHSNQVSFADAGSVPHYNLALEKVKKMASKNYYARLLGFDVTVDAENNIKIIEINNSSIEINFLQMNNGPLFGNFTDEIINYCLKNTKSVCLDYRI